MKTDPCPVELLLLGGAVLLMAAASVVRLLLVPLLALVLVACGWRPTPVAASSEEPVSPPLPTTGWPCVSWPEPVVSPQQEAGGSPRPERRTC